MRRIKESEIRAIEERQEERQKKLEEDNERLSVSGNEPEIQKISRLGERRKKFGRRRGENPKNNHDNDVLEIAKQLHEVRNQEDQEDREKHEKLEDELREELRRSAAVSSKTRVIIRNAGFSKLVKKGKNKNNNTEKRAEAKMKKFLKKEMDE